MDDLKKKTLTISCGLCDATGVTGEALAGYGKVRVNCGALAVTPAANRVLLGCGVELNAGSVINVPEGARVVSRTGSFTLEPGDPPREPAVLIVTGTLTVKQGAGAVLDGCAAVHVIGSVITPRSLAGRVQVTGSEKVYPDGYDYVDGNVELGAQAHLLWAGKKTYTPGRVVVSESARLDALSLSGAVFACKRAAVPESLVEKALAVLELSPGAKLTVIPDGAVYLTGKQTLTKALLRRGNRLYIDGGLTVERENAALLDELSYLHVTGEAAVPVELEEKLYDLDPACGGAFLYRGALVHDREKVTVDGALLERDGFVTVRCCEEVRLDEALTGAQIEEGLRLSRCDTVRCTPAQAAFVRRVSEEVDELDTGERPAPAADPERVCVSCGVYTF